VKQLVVLLLVIQDLDAEEILDREDNVKHKSYNR
jgi:hypothetical protein